MTDQRTLVVLLQRPYGEHGALPVPVREVVIAGLTWETDYWPAMAVAWIEQGVPLAPGLVDLLIEIGKKKYFPQQLRHKAKSPGASLVA